jgi:acylphosphatase
MSENAELYCIIAGRVQGVAYRNFAQSIARDLLISGFVANLPDGSVEILAQGNLGVLKLFKTYLQKGPPGARVGTIYDEWREPSKEFDDFKII